MPRVGAFVTLAALAAVTAVASAPSPSAAFGLRLGPLYIGLPFGGYRHHHRVVAHAEAATPARLEAPAMANPADQPEQQTAVTLGPASPLFYPAMALPEMYDDVFSPTAANAWPFGYDTIFHAAFAKESAENTSVCQPALRGNAVVEHLGAEVRPTAAQRKLLQKLGGALGMAAGFLARACPRDVPADPIARLQLMQTQLEELSMALDIVRPPLQEFEQSLNGSQQARYAAQVSAPDAAGRKNAAEDSAPACGITPTTIDSSVDQISQSLQPNDAQRNAMTVLRQAFERAATDIDARCLASLPGTPLARLELIESRIDAEWRAVLSIQTALSNLESGLSDEQKTRLNAIDFAAR